MGLLRDQDFIRILVGLACNPADASNALRTRALSAVLGCSLAISRRA